MKMKLRDFVARLAVMWLTGLVSCLPGGCSEQEKATSKRETTITTPKGETTITFEKEETSTGEESIDGNP